MELQEAIRLKLPKYLTGRPCKNGHVAERHTSTRTCVECMKMHTVQWREKHPERHRVMQNASRKRRKHDYNDRAKLRMRNYYRKKMGLPVAPYPEPERCENCNCIPNKGQMHLDHDHVTGAFRGWLCGKCNRGIGSLGDSLEGLQQAIRYLTRTLQ